MAQGVFGKAGTISFSVTQGPRGEIVTPHSLVSFSIYSDAPSDAQISDDDNSLGGAVYFSDTAWTSGASTQEKLLAYTAISDSTPITTRKWEKYFLVIRYRLESGGDVIREQDSLIMHRANAVTSRFGVVAADLDALERKLDDLLSGSQITAKIDLAERLVRQALFASGLDIQRLEWSDGKDLVRYLACSLCCKDLSNDPQDEWHAKADYYMEHYSKFLQDLRLGYDSDDDRDIEPLESVDIGGSSGFMFR